MTQTTVQTTTSAMPGKLAEMTLREDYAGRAMQGMLASHTEMTPSQIGAAAVMQADALLLALAAPAQVAQS